MARLTAREKRQIVVEYVAGATCRELAKKFTTSATTISKILKEEKSLQKRTKVDEVYNEEAKTLKQQAHDAIGQIMGSLSADLKKTGLQTKMSTMETLIKIFGLPDSAGVGEVGSDVHDELYKRLLDRKIEGFDDEQDDL